MRIARPFWGRRPTAAPFLLALATLLGLAGCRILQQPAAVTTPIRAIPLANQTPAVAATTAPATGGAPAAGATAAPAAAPPAATGSGAATTTFEIQQNGSQARFAINEVLRGSPFTAVGRTNQVAGQIAVDPNNPSAAQVGIIQIDARAFKTDDAARDRAIQDFILETRRYPNVTFTPSALKGLPASGKVGETYTFQIEGTLNLHGVTKPVTFDATITPVSQTQLKGSAKTTIRYGDYNIRVPRSPLVSNVDDSVNLQLDFVAAPVQ